MKTEIVVEVGNSHDGSVGIAISFIDMAVETGADVVKFQMHLGEHEGIEKEEFRVGFSKQDATRREYWNRINFSDSQWAMLSQYAESKDIEFLCTPFSVEAAEKLQALCKVKRWKIGSGDAPNLPFLDYLVSSNLPMIISTGLVSWDEILVIRERLMALGAWERTTLMHCVSSYPTPLEMSSLDIMDDLKELGCKVGLSDHSGKLSTALYALAKGIDMIEIHMTPHRKFFGPDVTSSLTVSEISSLVEYSRDFEVLANTSKTKSELFLLSEANRRLFRKGLYWLRSVSEGQFCTIGDLKFLKPSNYIDAINFEQILGKKLSQSVVENEAVMLEQFDGK
jgi:N-acetylneuraminate synthase